MANLLRNTADPKPAGIFGECINDSYVADGVISGDLRKESRRDQNFIRTLLRKFSIHTHLVAILLTMFSWSAFAVDGTNLPGHDYANFDAPSAFVCRTTCGGESRCQAYTWVKPGIQGPSGHCWLKDTLPAIVKDACCDSGPRQFISKRDLRAEDKINRPGLDFKNFTTNSWKTCEAACAEDGICASWTYVRPGVQGPTGRCWLKNRVARPVPDANTVSGVKFRPASVPFD